MIGHCVDPPLLDARAPEEIRSLRDVRLVHEGPPKLTGAS
jgi:hypothetical protein